MRLSLRPTRTAAIAASSVAATLALTVGGTAVAGGFHSAAPQASAPSVPAPPASPTRADQIQNIDRVRTAIKGYYGDTTTTTMDPVDGTTALHTYDPDGAYAKQMSDNVRKWGPAMVKSAKGVTNPAIVLDVDDTTLNTYNYEIYSNFVYNPTSNAAFVNAAAFPKVPAMPGLAYIARTHDITVLYLTGRPESQRSGTVQNLQQAGYAEVPADHLVLKDYNGGDPWLSSCAPSCTTTQYKTLSREHFEKDLGYHIIGDFGDQYSDLRGGHTDHTYKVPNPMYYLP